MAEIRDLVAATNSLQVQLLRSCKVIQKVSGVVFNQSIYHFQPQSSVAASPSGGPSGSGPSPTPLNIMVCGAPGSSKGSSRSFLDRPGDINTPTRNIWSPMSILSDKRRSGTSKPLNPPAKMKAKIPSWTHVFVCLACMEQDIVPDSSERAVLQIAGLGEKKLQFPIDAPSLYIYMMSWWLVFQSYVTAEVSNCSVLMIGPRYLSRLRFLLLATL